VFTGLVEAVVPLIALRKQGGGAVLEVECPKAFDDVKVGDSISVSGVCLTTLDASGRSSLRFDVSAESLSRSTLRSLRRGDRVNLERALKASDRLGGHIVAGHVDATTIVRSLVNSGEFWTVELEIADAFSRYVVEKGSVALDGISLTIAAVGTETFSIAVIPQTYQATNMTGWRRGTLVNVEVDIIGKYVERLLGANLVGSTSSRDDRLRGLLGG
jgi:riboflavin synthase